jgi:N-acetyl-anhydromuramyl-L-alanine amidase AmpD
MPIGSSLVTYTYLGPTYNAQGQRCDGGSQPSINIGVIHDIEAPIAAHYARTLCGLDYFGHGGDPGHPVSVHYVVGPDDICQGKSEDLIAYHVGTANPGTIGIEQCGYAAFTRDQWLAAGDPTIQLTNLAELMADISARNPLIGLRWLADGEALYAWNNKHTLGGWVTHKQLSRIGISTGHTDPGDGYPEDVLMQTAQGTTSTDWLDSVSVADLESVMVSVV